MKFVRIALSLLSLCLAGIPAQGASELLRNGDFRRSSEDAPAGWTMTDAAGVSWLQEEGRPALRLKAHPGQAPSVRQDVALPRPLPAALRVDAEVQVTDLQRGAKSWYSGRILVTYLDQQGAVLGETFTLDRLQGSSPWKKIGRQFPVPAGAAGVRLELQLLDAAGGSIAFRNVSLRALDGHEAEEWRAAAEERIGNIAWLRLPSGWWTNRAVRWPELRLPFFSGDRRILSERR